jgi:hypothetical protein
MKKYTYEQWQAIHRRKVIHTVKAYLLDFAVASFPFLLIIHYVLVGY